MLVLDDVEDPAETDNDEELYRVTAVPIDGGTPRRLSAIAGFGDYGVGGYHVVAALLPDLQLRETGRVDRGRWPTALRVAAAIVCAGIAMGIIRTVKTKAQTVHDVILPLWLPDQGGTSLPAKASSGNVVREDKRW